MTPEEITEFINSPDTVDFVVRRSELFSDLIIGNPDIVVTRLLAGRYIVCYARREVFDSLIDRLGSSFIGSASLVLGTLDRDAMAAAGITAVTEQPYLDLRGSGTIVGIVDTGIDFTSPAFRFEDGTTKIKYIYDQTVSENVPEGFFFGTEYTEDDINAALVSDDPAAVVPETDSSGHGTFIASVAAGRPVGDNIGAAPDADIVAVKLRRAKPYYTESYLIPDDVENAFSSSDVMIAVEYILDRARILNKPCSIIIGLGTNQGGHDGFGILEQYLDAIATLRGICVSAAAGNENEARHHASGVIDSTGDTASIDIRVGNAGSDVYLSVRNYVGDRLTASVRSPTGELVGRIDARPNVNYEAKLILERSTVGISYFYPLEGSGGGATIIKIVDATPGIWTVTLYGDIILDGRYDAWLPIDGFISPDTGFLLSDPNMTVTVPATMTGSICVGAYDSRDGSLYAKSSWGPTRSGRIAPDFVAPGVEIGGFYPYGPGTMSGTSVACAIAGGAAALMLEWGVVRNNDPSLSTYQIRAYLVRGADRDGSLSFPNNRWGYGKLDLISAFDALRRVE